MGISAISPTVNSFATPSQRAQGSDRPYATATTPISGATPASALQTGAADANASAKASDDASGSAESKSTSTSAALGAKSKLSNEALTAIGKLKARDLEVRQHEAAHLAAAGGLATSGASYTYEKGPDGVSYAIGGEVGIDVSPGRTPQETIERAHIVQAAALAPAEPSGPDLAVAAQAQQLEQEARGELARQQSDPSQADKDQPNSSAKSSAVQFNPSSQSDNTGKPVKDQQANVNRAYGVGDTPRTNFGLLNVYA
jgi:hypothetical protein